jgi:hypothetical protein
MLAWFEYCLDFAAAGVSRLAAASASAAAIDRSPVGECIAQEFKQNI